LRIQFGDSWRNHLDFFTAERTGFAGMRVKSCDGDSWSWYPPAVKKIFQQQADPDYLVLVQCGSDFAEREVGRDKRHSKLAAREQHREILRAPAVGKEFGLSRKPESDLIHSRLMNRPCHNGLDVTA